ncbi:MULTISPECIES: hypothetical protein [Streptomyces]|uniref:Uncharacterized protein n=1 Tax=Streptomyces morookaense TaxID=1970 RepID=A0A7Y7B587_STRMO|nr:MULTISPECIES: hypothetical protein [Streptomyces]MCC2274876.1 hypothetical protein [Streptomyces sp. ET3-23]NVK79249.1 hypothetical protein [Streptomyces morookaense]GHF27459.1 hypothetical protein GCM10010359_32190 [Streptomyces morookaense]
MANPHQQNPQGEYDPAGSTQMFRAFVDESAGAPAAPAVGGRAAARAARDSGPRVGMILGVIVAIVVVAGAAWLALS